MSPTPGNRIKHLDSVKPALLRRIPPPRKIVLVRASRIGDFICATPAFRAIRSAAPNAEITLIGLPFVEEMARRSPHLDRFIRFPGFPGMAEQFFDAAAAGRFFAAMQAEAFDLAIQMHGSGANSNPFTLLLGAGATAGFVPAGSSAGRLDAAFPYPPTGHEIDRVLALCEFVGAPTRGAQTEFPLWREDEVEADQILSTAARPLIGLHAGARDVIKRWNPERFAAVAHHLQRRWGGTVVVLGGEDERATPEHRMMPDTPQLDLVGRTRLPLTGAIIRRLAILITNDSGPAHIAYALGTPSVTVFGGTSPETWGPPAGPHAALAHHVPCRPCDRACCPIGYRCLESVGVDTVVSASNDILSRVTGNG